MKRRVNSVTKQTNQPFLNMYTLDMVDENHNHSVYYMASRNASMDTLKLTTKINKPDGVIIYALCKEEDEEKLVLIRQYRCPIDSYIYEFPAGLVDEGEDYKTAGVRELKEETGLDLETLEVDDLFSKPYFTTIGMTDESCATVYGFASGIVSKDGQEASEDIEIVLADRKEVRRILKEENVAIMCAYMCMHFLNTPKGHVFDFIRKAETDESI